MPLLKTTIHTIDDIYSLPDGQRAELIDGQIYAMAPPSPLHPGIRCFIYNRAAKLHQQKAQ